MLSILLSLIIVTSFLTVSSNNLERTNFRNCPVSTLQNEFSARCETKYPLEHFEFHFINNQSASMRTILADSKWNHSGCFATAYGASEYLNEKEGHNPATLSCARVCPVNNYILKVFRNKRYPIILSYIIMIRLNHYLIYLSTWHISW